MLNYSTNEVAGYACVEGAFLVRQYVNGVGFGVHVRRLLVGGDSMAWFELYLKAVVAVIGQLLMLRVCGFP